MNAQNAKDYLPLVQALAEGKMIQQFVMNRQMMEMEWRDDFTPTWIAEPTFYRVKPMPKAPRHWWVVIDTQTNTPHAIYTREDVAKIALSRCSQGKIVEVVEMMK